MTLEQGDLLNNRYKILDILGRGGMGSVYHAIDQSLGVEVAVKENLFVTADYEKQFRLEAVILANLRHPNLPRVTDHFTIDGQGQYLVMDYIEGRDLRHVMEHGPLPESEAIRIGIAVCDALNYLHTHKRPVLHRDIKPGNVRIAADGHVYLVDFGLAKMSNLDEHTLSGARAMTPGYSPPEQYGTSRTDTRTDIYSLGATLYAALTGYIPEDGLARVVDEVKLTPLRKRNAKISAQTASVVEKAMEPQSNNRYQSAEEFANALKSLDAAIPDEQPQATPNLPAQAVSSPTTGNKNKFPTTKEQRPAKRKTSPFAWIFPLLILIAASAFGFNWMVNNPQNTPEALKGLLALVISPTPTLQATEPLPTPKPSSNTATSTASASPSSSNTLTPTKPADETASIPTPTDAIAAPIATATGGGMGEIAFASIRNNTSQIYLINADGSNLRTLTNQITGACQPAWSPDGKKIVYVSPCAAKNDQYLQSSLFILDIESGETTRLTNDPGGDFEPAWSPDGTRIAYTSLREVYLSIYAINLADKTITRLTAPNNVQQSRQPSWSSDGSKIVYTVKRTSILRIWTMSADGSNQEQLLRNGGGSADYLPLWSKNGDEILFSQSNTQNTAPSALMRFKVDIDQTPEKLPVPLPVVDAHLSPDGNWIVYETSDTKYQDIDIYSFIDNGPPIPLTSDAALDFDPAWRPKPAE